MMKYNPKYKKSVKNFFLYLFLALVAAIMVFPFLWMLDASLKYDREIFAVPFRLLPESMDSVKYNYSTIWKKIDFLGCYLNTAKLAVIITILQLTTCSFAAFSFSRLEYPGRDKIFFLYLATIMIPQFMIIKQSGLYNSHGALILTQAFSAFGVFLLRQGMLTIPKELDDSAKIDGCNPPGMFWNIILPLSKPGLATLTIFTFKAVWNDYMAPMLYLEDKALYTIQLGLKAFKTQFSMAYGLTMAATVCSVIPIIIVYIFTQKYMVEGVAYTGLKG